MKTQLTVCLLAILCLSGCSTTKEEPILVKRPSRQIHTIANANIATETQAHDAAMRAEWKRTGAMSATAMFTARRCFTIDFSIPQFAKKGDRIWPVVMYELGPLAPRRIILVNAETGAIKPLMTEDNTCSEPASSGDVLKAVPEE